MGRCGANMDTDPSPSNVKMLTGIAEEMLKQKNVESVIFGGKRIGEQSNFEKLYWLLVSLCWSIRGGVAELLLLLYSSRLPPNPPEANSTQMNKGKLFLLFHFLFILNCIN